MLLLLALSDAHADGCSKTSVGKLGQVPSPSILVLGERKGTLPDLTRAASIVSKLAARGPVTVAVQAVHRDLAPALERYSTNQSALERLPEETDWSTRWGFPFDAYTKLFALRDRGVAFEAIGVTYGLKPADATFPLPPGYISVLAEAMGDGPVPVELETTTVETVAWADHQLAKQAIAGWDGEGVLVVLVDRFHVEGGLGVQWQAQRLAEVPVNAALLADADSRCYPSDALLP